MVDPIALQSVKEAGAPTLFIDTFVNVANSSEVVKLYMARLDPAAPGLPEQQSVIVGQLVLPMSGFLNTVAFFNSAVETLIKTGTISESAWTEAKRATEKNNVGE